MAIKILCAVVLLVELVAMSLGGTIHGTGTLKVTPVEKFWDGLTRTLRFPVILSGDLIALKLARSSGTPRWMRCPKSNSHCTTSSCPGGQVFMSSKFSSCRHEVFRIRTLGKTDGQAVESGDFVTITFPYYAESRHLWCSSSGAKCTHTRSLTPPLAWDRKRWFWFSECVFRILSAGKNANDGKPIQYGDIVGFKSDFQSNKSWLYSDGSKITAKSCTNGQYSKTYCAKSNTGFGFQIYKKI